MSVRFLADQCVPTQILEPLRAAGFDTVALRDVLSPKSPDPIVIAKAKELNRVLLSLNGDFSDIVSYPPADYQGIISIQLHNHLEIIPVLMDRLVHFLGTISEQKYFAGRLLLVELHRIRIRM